MKTRIKSFGVLQTAKFLALLYFLLTEIITIPFSLIGAGSALITGNDYPIPFWVFCLIPVAYCAFGFIFGLLFCWIYNLVARLMGGIEIELEQSSLG